MTTPQSRSQHASSSAQGSSLSAFHRMEALVYTDSSDRFSEWPTDVGPKGINFRSVPPRDAAPYPSGGRGRSGGPGNIEGNDGGVSSPPNVHTRLLKHRLTARASPPPPAPPMPPVSHAASSPSMASRAAGGPLLPDCEDTPVDATQGSRRQTNDAPVGREVNLPRSSVHSSEEQVISDKLHLLSKAEKLLNSVKKSIKVSAGIRPPPAEISQPAVWEKPTAASLPPSDDEIYHLLDGRYARPSRPPQKSIHSSFHSGSATPGGDLAGIQWLLAGLPDVYSPDEETDCISDEVVDRLLKEGGPTPSQLVYPSFYQHSQQKLNRLAFARRLRITLSNLHVYSSRSGLRKSGSFVVITPPCGTVSATGRHLSRQLPLEELEDASMAAMARTNQRKHVNVLHEYFVGSVELKEEKFATWDIMLTDEIVNSWMTSHGDSRHSGRTTPSGSIKLEFFSLLRPQSTHPLLAGSTKDPYVRIGYLDIPMSGLLGAAHSFDVVMSSEIALDTDSNAVVAARLDRMPTGGKRVAAGTIMSKCDTSNGPKMGSVSARIMLLTDKNVPLYLSDTVGDKKTAVSIAHPALSNSKPSEESNKQSDRLNKNALDNAMEFIPEEFPIPKPLDMSYVGVAVHSGVVDIARVRALLAGAVGEENMPRLGARLFISVEYKVSVETGSIRNSVDSHVLLREGVERVSTVGDAGGGRTGDMYVMSFDENLSSKIYEVVDMSKWRPLLFEVWVEWLSPNIFSKKHKKLLGIAKFSEVTVFHPHVRLPVRELGIGSCIGMLDVSCHLDQARETVQKDLMESIALSRVEYDRIAEPSTAQAPEPSVLQLRGTSIADSVPSYSAYISRSINEELSDLAVDLDLDPRANEPPIPIRQAESPVQQRFAVPLSTRPVESGSTSVSDTELLGLMEYARNFDDLHKGDLVPLQRRRLEQLNSAEEAQSAPTEEDGEEPAGVVGESMDHTTALPTKSVSPTSSLEGALGRESNQHTIDLNSRQNGMAGRLSQEFKYISHIMDLSVVGTGIVLSDVLSVVSEDGSTTPDNADTMDAMGFFLFYDFPGSNPTDSDVVLASGSHPPGCEHSHSIWWDKQCSILNGHRRHVVDIAAAGEQFLDGLKLSALLEGLTDLPGSSSARELSLRGRQEYAAIAKQKLGLHDDLDSAVVFKVVASDAEGGLSADARVMATAVLTVSQLLAALGVSGFADTIVIPLKPATGFMFARSNSSLSEIGLKISITTRVRPRCSGGNRGDALRSSAEMWPEAFKPDDFTTASFSAERNLPLLRRVDDFKWNKSIDLSENRYVESTREHEGEVKEGRAAEVMDVDLHRSDEVASEIKGDADRSTTSAARTSSVLHLQLETLAHLSDLSSLCNPAKHSWRNYIASPLVYFVGTLYLGEHCFSCNSTKDHCTCPCDDTLEGPQVEWVSCEVFRTVARPLSEIVGSGVRVSSSDGSCDAHLAKDTLDLSGMDPIEIKFPQLEICERNIEKLLRRCTLRIAIHVRYDWSMTGISPSSSQPQLSSVDYLRRSTVEPLLPSRTIDGTLPIADSVLGSVAVDLYMLAVQGGNAVALENSHSNRSIDGWYHVIDNAQRCHGQLKLSVSMSSSDRRDTALSATVLSAALSEPCGKVEGEVWGNDFEDDEGGDESAASLLKGKLQGMLSALDMSSKLFADNGYMLRSAAGVKHAIPATTSVEYLDCSLDLGRSEEEEEPLVAMSANSHPSPSRTTFVTELVEDDSSELEEELSEQGRENEIKECSGGNELDQSGLSIIAGTLEEDDESWPEWPDPEQEWATPSHSSAASESGGKDGDDSRGEILYSADGEHLCLDADETFKGHDNSERNTCHDSDYKVAESKSDWLYLSARADKHGDDSDLPVLQAFLADHKEEIEKTGGSSSFEDMELEAKELRPDANQNVEYNRDESKHASLEDSVDSNLFDEKMCVGDSKMTSCTDFKEISHGDLRSSASSSSSGDLYVECSVPEAETEADVSYGSKENDLSVQSEKNVDNEDVPSHIIELVDDCGDGSSNASVDLTRSFVDVPQEKECKVGGGGVCTAQPIATPEADLQQLSSATMAGVQKKQLDADSPDTAKIRRLIDNELSSSVFRRESTPAMFERSRNQNESREAGAQCSQGIQDSRIIERFANNNYKDDAQSLAGHSVSATSMAYTGGRVVPLHSSRTIPIDVAVLVRNVMSKYESSAPTNAATAHHADNIALPYYPGRRRQFVELETARISKIMLGTSML